MLYRLVSPVQRKGTRNVQLVKRIPADLRERLVGTMLNIPIGRERARVKIGPKTTRIRLTLGTADPAEAKVRQGEALAYLEQLFRAARTDAPIMLTHRQATALAGRLYRSWAASEGRERERSISFDIDMTSGEWGPVERRTGELPPEEAEAVYEATIAYLDRVKASGEAADLEPVLGALVDRMLQEEGVGAVDADSRATLLDVFRLALKDAMEVRHRNAAGDYSPDPKADRFPEWQHPREGDGPALTLTGLVDDWWNEAQSAGRARSTYVNYRGTIRKLIAFLKHDDARRVTAEDVVRFKNHRLAEGVSARTVKDQDLAGLKSVFGWAVSNRKLITNPAEGVTVMRERQARTRPKGFTADEVKAILGAALKESHSARRWIPWLLAYTGARVGEIIQLRKQDVVKTGRHWNIVITPEAGTVKTGEPRTVPLHPHLVEQGFVRFAQEQRDGYLFVRPNRKTGDVAGPVKGQANHLREFVRQYVSDPKVQPNHAWRHLFITRCRQYGVGEDIQRMLTGHSAKDVHGEYGDPAGLYEAIRKLLRFEIQS